MAGRPVFWIVQIIGHNRPGFACHGGIPVGYCSDRRGDQGCDGQIVKAYHHDIVWDTQLTTTVLPNGPKDLHCQQVVDAEDAYGKGICAFEGVVQKPSDEMGDLSGVDGAAGA